MPNEIGKEKSEVASFDSQNQEESLQSCEKGTDACLWGHNLTPNNFADVIQPQTRHDQHDSSDPA